MDLTEETFWRFFSRKSLLRLEVLDNTSTFMAAADDLKHSLNLNKVKESLGNQGIEWRLIPCHAPWFGGYWERLVGLTKNALKKTLGCAFIILASLQTLIVEIEAHLNNRPLTYVSSKLNEPEPLMPAHLLYGRVINTVPHAWLPKMNWLIKTLEASSQLHHTLSRKPKCKLYSYNTSGASGKESIWHH